MRVATYSRWALIRGWALIKFLDLDESGLLIQGGCLFEAGAWAGAFHHFQQVRYVYFATKK